jgi:hypothetical protein
MAALVTLGRLRRVAGVTALAKPLTDALRQVAGHGSPLPATLALAFGAVSVQGGADGASRVSCIGVGASTLLRHNLQRHPCLHRRAGLRSGAFLQHGARLPLPPPAVAHLAELGGGIQDLVGRPATAHLLPDHLARLSHVRATGGGEHKCCRNLLGLLEAWGRDRACSWALGGIRPRCHLVGLGRWSVGGALHTRARLGVELRAALRGFGLAIGFTADRGCRLAGGGLQPRAQPPLHLGCGAGAEQPFLLHGVRYHLDRVGVVRSLSALGSRSSKRSPYA